MGTIFMWLKKSQSPKIFVAVPRASHFLTFNHLFAIIFSSAKDVVYINYTGRILRKRPSFWSPLPLYLSFLYDLDFWEQLLISAKPSISSTVIGIWKFVTKQLRNFEKLAKFRRVKLARKKLKLKTIVQLSQVWDRNLRQFLL